MQIEDLPGHYVVEGLGAPFFEGGGGQEEDVRVGGGGRFDYQITLMVIKVGQGDKHAVAYHVREEGQGGGGHADMLCAYYVREKGEA